jgi:Protein of unknown function (DUF4235)
MSDKRGEGVSRVVGTFAAVAAAMATRKLVTAGWKRLTGKEPPSDPHDPQVGFGEALSWAIVLGVTMETARLVAQRAATRRMRRDTGADSGTG